MIRLFIKNNNLKPNAGQSLIEILIGLSVGSVIIGASTMAITGILRSSTASQNTQAASTFNQETLDRVRSFANANWQSIANLTRGTSTQYFLNATGSTFFIVQGKEGMVDNDVQSGIVAHWGFDEATSTTATSTYDGTGNNNTGNMIGGVLRATSTCKLSTCLSFDGTDDYVDVGDIGIANYQAMTVAMWLYRNDSTARSVITTNPAGAGQNGKFYWDLEVNLQKCGAGATTAAGAITFCSGKIWNGNFSYYTDASVVPASQWTHVAATWNGSSGSGNGQIYVNGVAVTTSYASEGTFTSPTDYDSVKISPSGSFAGQLDEVRIYNRALSANEVKQLYEGRIFARSFSVENVCRTNNASSSISGTGTCASGSVNDPLTQKITALTEWTPSGGTASQFTAVDYITRTRNAAFHQTDWSGGSGQEGSITTPSTRFASGTSVSTSTPGSFRIQGL